MIRELPITDGYNLLDDNLLACSDDHIRGVFAMLARQREPIEFTGGLEAARLKPWHVASMTKLRIKQMFFAYDTPDDLEPLQIAGVMFRESGLGITSTGNQSHRLRCFVLCGYPRDTMTAAEIRMEETKNAGFTPMAMLWKDKTGKRDPEWGKFQREWARPAIIYSKTMPQEVRR